MGQGFRNGPELTTTLTVEKLVPGGGGFCRLPDGRSAFLDGAFPGDRVLVRAFEDKQSYVRATSFEVVEPSPERAAPPCPIADACGGCDWMRLELAAQRRYKAGLVVEALERTGGVRLPVLPEVVARGEALGYRARVRVHVSEQGVVGFYGRRTRSLVPLAACAVAHAALNQALATLAALEPPLAELLAAFEAAELAVAPDGASVDARLWPRKGVRAPRSIAPLLEHLARHGILARVTPRASAKGAEAAPTERPWAAFTQVNPAVNEALVAAVTSGADARGAGAFLDLYAGSGNFSLPLAAGGRKGTLVELDAVAADSARREAAARGVALEVLALDAVRGLEKLAARRVTFDLVVLDPPRAGAREAIPGIVAVRPRLVAYVSCDPVTLARDLKQLVRTGYRVESVECFDMFPHTHHVESLVWLART